MTTVSVIRGFHFLSAMLLVCFVASPLLARTVRDDQPATDPQSEQGKGAPSGRTASAQAGAFPREYDLAQNFPNPFNPSTVIRYAIPVKSHVLLTVHNLLGQLVATIVNGDQDAGFHEIRFDAPNLSSGVYLYRLEAGKFVQTRKLTLIR
jgi:hypothetical protein